MLLSADHQPPPTHPLPPLLFTPLLSEVIFYSIIEFSPAPHHHHLLFHLLFLSTHSFVWFSGVPLILFALQISTLFRRGMPTPLQCLTLASSPLPPTHTYTLMLHIKQNSPHRLDPTLTKLFRKRENRSGVRDSHNRTALYYFGPCHRGV